MYAYVFHNANALKNESSGEKKLSEYFKTKQKWTGEKKLLNKLATTSIAQRLDFLLDF